MYRSDRKSKYAVRFNGYETRVDVVGNLTMPDLDWLIATLIQARDLRQAEREGRACCAQGIAREGGAR